MVTLYWHVLYTVLTDCTINRTTVITVSLYGDIVLACHNKEQEGLYENGGGKNIVTLSKLKS